MQTHLDALCEDGQIAHRGSSVDGERLIESTKPLAKVLSETIGEKVEVVTATNYVGIVEGIGASKIDFAIIPPFAYVLANKESGAQIILKALNKKGKSYYRSVFFVNKDSGINSVQDLKGKMYEVSNRYNNYKDYTKEFTEVGRSIRRPDGQIGRAHV